MSSLRFSIPLTALLAAVSIVWIGPASPLSASDGYSLPKLERRIAKRFPTVASLTLRQFQTGMQHKGEIVVLDVREPGEFGVSRLAKSERVDPDISKLEFLKRFAGKAKGKTFVLYCSVGYRSSKLAAVIQEGLKQAGAEGVYNLQGGIFAWHNGAKPLVSEGNQATRLVHPYSEKWGQYLTNRDLTSYGRSSGWRIFN